MACVPAGIEFVAAQLKSLVLTLGLIDLHLTVEQAVLLSRLEEEYQVRSSTSGPAFPFLVQTRFGGTANPSEIQLCIVGFHYFCVHAEIKIKDQQKYCQVGLAWWFTPVS